MMTEPHGDNGWPKWYELPIEVQRDRYGQYHVFNGENGGGRLPERHYWPTQRD